MLNYTTEARTFLGIDGFGGYQQSQAYLLRYLRGTGGSVAILADHQPGRSAVSYEWAIARWWSAPNPSVS